MFRDVKKGDKVYALTKGWGKITDIDLKNIYIVVSFEDGDTREFFIDGKYYEDDKFPSLFWEEVKFDIPKNPLPRLEVDTKVLVWATGSNRFKRYFSHFNEDGDIVCFCSGADSWSSAGGTSAWSNWELADD
jgi:hypothetical protein